MTYIDTSVLVAYYCPEAMSTQAERAMQKATPPTISPLVEVELFSALARKIREGDLAPDDADRITAQFLQHLDQNRYLRLPVDTAHYTLARDWIGRFTTPLRTLDALHLAITATAQATLLTADHVLAAAAHHFGLPALRLDQAGETES